MAHHQQHGAHAPGQTAPVESATPGGSGQALQGDRGTVSTPIVSAFDSQRKSFEHARALAALAGCTLHELASGGYLLGRGMCRELPDLRAVHTLLAQMGVR